MNIPFVDLRSQCQDLKDDVVAAIESVIDSAGFILGKEVGLFEEEFADFCGAKHCVGLSNGSEALHLALRACGIGRGDEVITAGNSFAATALAIRYADATPVLVDVDPADFNLDPDLVEQAITPQTRAIIPVHLYGQPARMDELVEIANRYDLKVIEDACQAHGAEYRGRRTGTLGDAGCFSFYPGKNLGAFGDGGALVTDDDQLADEVRVLRNYGQRVKNEHEVLGYNCRLDTLQAAILLVKLSHLEAWTEARRRAADAYRKALSGHADLILPTSLENVRHVYHLFVVRHPNRDGMLNHLHDHGIQCGVHYPHPLHHAQPFREARTVPDGLPICSQLAREILSLPMCPKITTQVIDRIANVAHTYTPELVSGG